MLRFDFGQITVVLQICKNSQTSWTGFVFIFSDLVFYVCSTWLARIWLVKTWWTDVVSITREHHFIQGLDGYDFLASSIINKPNILHNLIRPQGKTQFGKTARYFQLFSFTNKFGNTCVFMQLCLKKSFGPKNCNMIHKDISLH